MRKHIRNFIWLLFGMTVFCIVILVLVNTTFISRKFDMSNFGNLSSMIQATIGIAVALAGVIVTLEVAYLGFSIVDQQNKRENKIYANSEIERALKPIQKVAKSINKIQTQYLIIDRQLQPYIEKYFTLEEGLKIPMHSFVLPLSDEEVEMIRYKSEIAKQIDELCLNLEMLIENPLSYDLWYYKTQEIQYHLKNPRYYGGFMTVNKDLELVIQTLKFRSKKINEILEDLTLHNLLAPSLTAAEIFAFQPNDRESLFLFNKLGAEIFYMVESNKRDIAITGAAILADLILTIPTIGNIKRWAVELFGKDFKSDSEVFELPIFRSLELTSNREKLLGTTSIPIELVSKVEFCTGDYSQFGFEP